MNKTEYMRQWKRNKYAVAPDVIKECNRTAYYKSKYNGTKEDVVKYGEHFPAVSKIIASLEELKEQNVDYFRDIIRKYVNEIT